MGTGKSLSKGLIYASPKPQYDDRLSIELWVQYMKIASSEHVLYTNWFFVFFQHSEQFMYTPSFEHVLSLQFSCTYWTCNSMNNLSSYCGLVDVRKIASEKDLPVFLNY